MPITAPDEMNMTMDLAVERLKAVPGYAPLFRDAFGGEAPITAHHVTAALATFQRTLVSGEAPFDRWVSGDERAIAGAAKRGFVLFTGALAAPPAIPRGASPTTASTTSASRRARTSAAASSRRRA